MKEEIINRTISSLHLSDDSDKLNLTCIPSDVIRNIISLEPNFINIMMLISLRWNSLARSHIHNRQHLPPIESLIWRLDRSNKTTVTIGILEKHRTYFGGKHLTANSGTKDIIRISLLENDSLGPSVLDTLSRMIDRCSRLKELGFEVNDELFSARFVQYMANIINGAMENAIIDKVTVNGVVGFQRDIALHFLRARKEKYRVPHLVMTSNGSEIVNAIRKSTLTALFKEVSIVELRAVDKVPGTWSRREWESLADLLARNTNGTTTLAVDTTVAQSVIISVTVTRESINQ